ncbi:MAG: TonB-dependent receptor [Moraxellaceae bacterium]
MKLSFPISLPLLPLAAAISLSAVAYAEEATTETSTTLPQIVVSASRTPETAGIASSHVQIISSDDIAQSGTRNVADLLRQVASIQLIDAAGDNRTPSIGMRGFGDNGSQNSLLLLDGRRLNNDTDIGTSDLNNLSIDDIDHIEIINGSAGSLFGSSAVGGVINIITKSVKRSVDAGISRGSDDLVQYRVKAAERIDSFGIQVIGEKSLADNYRDRNEVNDSFVKGKLTWDDSFIRAYLEGSQQKRLQNLPGSLFADQMTANRRQANYFNNYSDNDNQSVAAGAAVTIAKNWEIRLDSSRRVDDNNGVLTQGGLTTDFLQKRRQESINPQLNGFTDFGDNRLKLVAGYDADSARYYFQSSLGDMSNDQDVRSLYAQLGWGFGKDLEIVAGGRHAKLESELKDSNTYISGIAINDSVDTGSLAIYWSPAGAFTTWLRADQNFRFALTDEQTGIVYGATSPLETQEGISYETGLRFQSEALSANAQLYQLSLEKEISYDPTQYGNVNLDDTRRRGAGLQLTYQVAPTFNAGIQLAYVDAEFTAGAAEGKQIPSVAKDNATLSLGWQAFSGFNAAIEQQRLGKRYAGGDYSNALPELDAINLTNLAFTYTWQKLDTALRINNLFNREDPAYATAAFRPFPVVETAYMPAAERSMVLSLSYHIF